MRWLSIRLNSTLGAADKRHAGSRFHDPSGAGGGIVQGAFARTVPYVTLISAVPVRELSRVSVAVMVWLPFFFSTTPVKVCTP